MAETGLSLVIPAYNESGGIAEVLDGLLAMQTKLSLPSEIIVVDDGSEDDTAQIIKQKYPSIYLIQHPVNRGYGAALKTGLRHAAYELICITDADGTYPNDRIPELLEHLQKNDYDMIVGARVGANTAIPLVRRPAKWVIRKLAEIIADSTIPDINSGLRIFKRSIAQSFIGIFPNGFSFTTTITLSMLSRGYMVAYEPIDYYARIGQSKIKPIRDTLNFVQLILRMALYFEPLKIFIPMSIFLFFLAIAWGVFSIIVLDAFADNSMFLIAMTSLQVAMLGLLAEIINRRLDIR